MDILSSVKYRQKDYEQHRTKTRTDQITAVDITTVTDLYTRAILTQFFWVEDLPKYAL